MNNCFIILAAGESKRFNSKTPKQYHLYNGKPLIQHSIDKAKLCKKLHKIIIVVNKKHKKFIKNLKIKNIKMKSLTSYERLRITGKKKVNEFKDGFLILISIIRLFIFKK